MQSAFREVINILLIARPQSSTDELSTILQGVISTIADEALNEFAKSRETSGITIVEVWERVKDRPAIEKKFREFLGKVSRPSLIYVFSRFKNSRAIGPPIIRVALGVKLEELKGKESLTSEERDVIEKLKETLQSLDEGTEQ